MPRTEDQRLEALGSWGPFQGLGETDTLFAHLSPGLGFWFFLNKLSFCYLLDDNDAKSSFLGLSFLICKMWQGVEDSLSFLLVLL